MRSVYQSFVIYPASSSDSAAAHALALELDFQYLDHFPEGQPYALQQSGSYLGLVQAGSKPFYIDFAAGKMRYRSDQASHKRELLAKALGKKPKNQLHIVDATAGLGRDSYILAKLGYTVTMLEKSPIVFALLRNALERASKIADLAENVQRLKLIYTDAEIWLNSLTKEQQPDITYLDPMFPDRNKSASVKKEMVILQHLLQNDSESETLLTTALACSHDRVVVKRPRLAGALQNKTPSYSLTGKSSRFDIYLVP